MHNKQFIITNRKVRLDNFKSIVWIDGYILNYHNELNVVKVGNSILIGHAFQGDFNRKIPEEELVSMDSPIDTYNTWNGRWALLYKNEIHPDASAQMGIFYGDIKGELVISSSLSLIAEVYKGEYDINEHMPLEYNILLSWIPGPYTIINGINRLLPTQYLRFDTEFDICFRNPISKTDYSMLSEEEIYKKIYELQECSFKYIEKYDFKCNIYTEDKKNVFNIGLTAGYDSRMQVALLNRMGLSLKAHTFERRKSTELADNRYPSIIAEILGIDWEYITIGKKQARRVIEYNAHTFNSVKDRDWKWHYTCGQYDEVDGDIIVSNSIWESFSDYYVSFGLTANLNDRPETKLDDLKTVFETLEGNYVSEKSFKKYIEWVDDNPIKGLSWADRITFEQLMGIWDGNENQGKDLFSHEKFLFNPANSMEIFALVTALPKEKRQGRLWEKEIVNLFVPELKDIPYNEPNTHVNQQFWYPYGDELYGKNIILYGAGNVGRSYYLQITTNNSSNIVAWVDKKYKDINRTGIAVNKPEIIPKMKYDYIIIAVESKKVYESIKDELIKIGVDPIRILWKETKNV